jgi:hypothetical protein
MRTSYAHVWECSGCGHERTWGESEHQWHDRGWLRVVLLCEGTCKNVEKRHGLTLSVTAKPMVHTFVRFKPMGLAA